MSHTHKCEGSSQSKKSKCEEEPNRKLICVTVVSAGALKDFPVSEYTPFSVQRLREKITKETGVRGPLQLLFLIVENSADGGNDQRPLKDTYVFTGECSVLLIAQTPRWDDVEKAIVYCKPPYYDCWLSGFTVLSGNGNMFVTTAVLPREPHIIEDGFGLVVIVHNVKTGAEVYKFECGRGFSTEMRTVELSADGKWLLTVETKHDEQHAFELSSTVVVHNVETGAEQKKFEHTNPVKSAILSGDGKKLVVVEKATFDTAVVIVRNVETGADIQKFEHAKVVESLALSEDGKTLLTVETDHDHGRYVSSTVIVRNAETGTELQKFKHAEPVKSSALSGDGTLMLTVEGETMRVSSTTVAVRNVATGETILDLKYQGYNVSCTLSADGKLILTTCTVFNSKYNTTTIWDVDTGAKLHEDCIDTFGYPLLSGDGRSLFAETNNGHTLTMWRDCTIPADGEPCNKPTIWRL